MAQNEPPALLGFGDFIINRRERSLHKHGIRLKLHGQPFEILLLLLEHPGEVVTREELQAKLWHGDTFVDFENGLNAAVKKLRQTLGDSAESPRYVETMPRVGYRFLAPLMSVQYAEVVTPVPEELKSSPAELPTLVETRAGHRRWILLAAAALLLVSFAAVWFRKTHAAPPLKENDLVLVSDFVNTTGDPVFDDTLKRALTVKLSESPHFNILNEYNLRETLRLMERLPTEKLVPPADREVCQRAGAKVAIGGSIIALGAQYVITLDAKNCMTGGIVAHQEGRSADRERVLSTLGDLIPPLRRKLGESLGAIEKFNTPILEATTPSLTALKAYAQGDRMRFQGSEAESVPYYLMAVELDPNFAIAYARLGALYRNLSQLDLSRLYMRKAFDLRQHASEKEKFYIAAHYYSDFTQEVDKSVQTYELWTQTYPRDWIPYNNLADVASRSGLVDKAIPAAQKALQLNPNSWFTYGALSNSYLKGSRFAEAKAICDRAAAENHGGATISNTLLRIAYIEGDQATVDRVLATAEGKGNESLLLALAATATSGLGKIHAAHAFAQRSERVAIQKGLHVEASNTAYDESLFEAELGYAPEARASVERAVHWNSDPASLGYAALTYARLGDANRAEGLVKAADISPLDTLHNIIVLATARAAIELDRKNPNQAIEELKAALPYDLCELSSGATFYIRGLAYLDAGFPKDAEVQFQKLADNHGSAVTVYWLLAHLGLARAFAAGGETEKAVEAYHNLFGIWKDADPGLPVLRQARAEYRRLDTIH
jgi:eukaryotic-like serine/threonine-protein kinase